MSNNSIPAKDVIYIDVEDEITTIIDKVTSSRSKILALVLPKRATTLQSIVNMKLLKRAADNDNKHLVLITSETGLLPLAANTGLYVAKNLQSKPEVPDVPQGVADLPDDFEESLSLDAAEPKLNKKSAVGDLAKDTGSPTVVDDAIDMSGGAADKNPIMRNMAAGAGSGAVVGHMADAASKDKSKDKAPKGPRNKKLSVPNFNNFRAWTFIGGGALVALIVLWIVCFKVLPHSYVTIKTDSQAISANVNVTLSSSVSSVNTDSGIIPAKTQSSDKTLTAAADATGQQNNGQKASGTVRFYLCNQGDTLSGTSRTIPAGTGITANGLTFITVQNVTVQPSHYKPDGSCRNDQPSDTVNVNAQNAGAKYNVSSATYSVAGFSSVTGAGTDMSGGTDDITKIVQSSDIESAKSKISAQDTSAIKTQLKSQLENQGLKAIDATFVAGTPSISTSVSAGAAADNVTVTEKITYTMMGAAQADLKKLVASAVDGKIDTSKQTITDYGLDDATFTSQDPSSGSVTMAITAVAGPDLKIADLRKQVAGKKTGDAQKILKANPGVTDVNVTYSPFWVTSIPGNQSKITITIEKPTTTTNAN
ncbi:MAG TPA: hypothetical protein VJ843_03475 [Candidatus Saccharimonadales bacterium]|nr:hypothetical protein [Candidatus Saccharimonadales bacterium]